MHGLPMLPFYIYYSMFGFQRVGDQIQAAADRRPRGFLLGATSGRTTLGSEGLQHQDGTSHLLAATITSCRAYDPGFAGEMAVIVDAGMREMLIEQRDVSYDVTLMNENYEQPSLPANVYGEVLRGCYRYDGWKNDAVKSGGQRLTPPHIARQRVHSFGPIMAVTDYVRAVPKSVHAFLLVDRCYLTLGTDGFGRSDTRAELRKFCGVDAATLVRVAKVTLGNGA